MAACMAAMALGLLQNPHREGVWGSPKASVGDQRRRSLCPADELQRAPGFAVEPVSFGEGSVGGRMGGLRSRGGGLIGLLSPAQLLGVMAPVAAGERRVDDPGG